MASDPVPADDNGRLQETAAIPIRKECTPNHGSKISSRT